MLIFKYDAPFIEAGSYIEIHSEIHAAICPDHPDRVEVPFTTTIFNEAGEEQSVDFHDTLFEAVRGMVYDVAWCARHTGDSRFDKLTERTLQSQANSDLTLEDFKLVE